MDDSWKSAALGNSEDESVDEDFGDEDYTDEDDDDDDDVEIFHDKNKRRKCAKNSKSFKKGKQFFFKYIAFLLRI